MPVSDIFFMEKALDLARKARGKTSPNPMVGCVIVKGNKIIASGFHQKRGLPHAEAIALKKAGEKARGAKLYVNLEPCFHFGNTPPCVDAIIKSGIKEVIIAAKDPNRLTDGKSIAKLKKSGIKVKMGVLNAHSRALNESFMKYINTKMPFVATKTAQTIDGKIAARNGNSKWITDKNTREFARGIRDEFDAILAGINTVLKDDPCLCAKSKNIKKIIVDSRLRISPKARLFEKSLPEEVYLAVTENAPQKRVQLFRDKGCHVIIAPEKEGRVDLKWLFKTLAREEITSILIEGGSTVIGQALKKGLVDKMYFYIAPKVAGDKSALSSINGLALNRMDDTINLSEMEARKIGKDILITAYVLRNS
ncbi:MAG: bifunctional diaminohydroxyphosphoribosylaminopyrimidine deaminase/5-amino-6-(5-phosphoribosylamino)uracil reductase RibD [Candidatus Omnitrophica bacterium]|nr:bifunctional diaminohydroxyphosphoribosylaminopyrimidine deaminase/5-amino-6-(5-phosphoribosylamino)uracil reductase RibD [Candidatus Omnitrophota bacterium]